MKLRPPAYPLITVDPYFNIWSMKDNLAEDDTRLWSGDRVMLLGRAEIDGEKYAFMGSAEEMKLPQMKQISVEVTTFTTKYVFEAAGVELAVDFTTPLLPDDLNLVSRPVSYINTTVSSVDGKDHTVSLEIKASEEFCMENYEDLGVTVETVKITDTVSAMKLGGIEQAVLGKSGDGIGIDWGYLYLAAENGEFSEDEEFKRVCVSARKTLDTNKNNQSLFVLAYDDIKSLVYFGEQLDAYWKAQGRTIEQEIEAAFCEYTTLISRTEEFHKKLVSDATAAGGEKYSDLLVLAFRQVIAAHKLVLDKEGKVLFVSKECFSNGCAATADVSYPSIPMLLVYNTELAKGLMRPILRYAGSKAWPYPFAPHDVGRYPILNGQAYSRGTKPGWQMPVEECGNMLLMAAATALAEQKTDFVEEHKALFDLWAEYLLENGLDPTSQVTSDDFAGHVAHNCNLSMKAIMALGAYSEVCNMMSCQEAAQKYRKAAEEMTEYWMNNSKNADGSYRLAFDREGSYSLKYNAVWNKVMGLELLPKDAMEPEIKSYIKRQNPYGMPLIDNSDFTNSGWIIWSATMASSQADFEALINPVWTCFNISPSRVPLPDWYSSITSIKLAGQNRTVQGALFMKLLDYKKICFRGNKNG